MGVVFTGWSEYRLAGCLCGCCVYGLVGIQTCGLFVWVLCLRAGRNTDLRVVCVGVVFKDSQAAWNIDSVRVVCVGVVFTGWSE